MILRRIIKKLVNLIVTLAIVFIFSYLASTADDSDPPGANYPIIMYDNSLYFSHGKMTRSTDGFTKIGLIESFVANNLVPQKNNEINRESMNHSDILCNKHGILLVYDPTIDVWYVFKKAKDVEISATECKHS